jgi:hypothetical protein
MAKPRRSQTLLLLQNREAEWDCRAGTHAGGDRLLGSPEQLVCYQLTSGVLAFACVPTGEVPPLLLGLLLGRSRNVAC